MKTLFLIALTFSTWAFGETHFTNKEFLSLNADQKMKVVDAYKDFLREASTNTKLGEFASFRFSLISEAFASGNFDCFYAGWPSQSVRSGGKKLCTTPVRGNPDYPRQASSCGANSLLCQPAIFGSGLCVSVANQKLRNSAFAQCEKKFSDNGRTTADVVRELSPPDQRADLNELISVSENICANGLQAGTNMCSRLKNQLISIRSQLPAASAPQSTPLPTSQTTLINVAETATRITSTRIEPRAEDCDPNTPGIQTVPPQQIARVEPQSRPQPLSVVASSGRIRGVSCARRAPTQRSMEDMTTYLRTNNISIVSGTVTDIRHLQRFVDDFEKFPPAVREEMKRKGSEIRLIVGNGVSEDPSWARESARSNRPGDFNITHDGRDWSNVGGAGGFLGIPKTPTRLVINKNYESALPSVLLHEYAHTMDRMYGEYAISRSRIWQNTLASEPRARDFLSSLCADNYCNDPAHGEEAFAELFANYHACPETKANLETYMPKVARFFERMTNVRDLLDGRINFSDRAPASSR